MRYPLLVVATVAAVTLDRGATSSPQAAAPKLAVVPAATVPSAPSRPSPTRWKPSRPHSMRRSALAEPNCKVELPRRGIVFCSWGLLGAGSIAVVDADKSRLTLRTDPDWTRTKAQRRTVKLAAINLAYLMQLAEDAWDEEPDRPPIFATDVRQDLYILDGEEVFYLSGHPIGFDHMTNRPAAVQLFHGIEIAANF